MGVGEYDDGGDDDDDEKKILKLIGKNPFAVVVERKILYLRSCVIHSNCECVCAQKNKDKLVNSHFNI